MIFDCHTHWGDCYQARDGLAPARWLEAWDRQGITHGAVFPFAGLINDSAIGADNDAVAAVCAKSAGRMLPFCTINTWQGEQAVEEATRCLEVHRIRGIKIHPWLQGLSPNSPGMDRLCELAAEHRVPILFHDGTPCFSLPSQMAVLARRHPRTTIILGHCGLLEHWREAIAAMNAADNLWGCLCGPHRAALRRIVRLCDGQRLVWGSDHGFTFEDMPAYFFGVFGSLDISDKLRHDILDLNPRRLFAMADH
ncbi:MAG: amidohydrolase family protein [Phycisphaeraceae bacterium]|nr:amidohydrolase family protein [Phycisphaeraceae bacterium]